MALGHNQDGGRPAHWLLIAAPAVVAVAWQFLQGGGSGLFSVLYLGALALVPVLAWGIWPVRCDLVPPAERAGKPLPRREFLLSFLG